MQKIDSRIVTRGARSHGRIPRLEEGTVSSSEVSHGLRHQAKVGLGMAAVAGAIVLGANLMPNEHAPTDQDLINKGWTQDQVDAMHNADQNLQAPEDTVVVVSSDQTR